ncbi:serine/threonine-protein kinase [Streptomyces guryensis]|uniref:non-specific serine/threonine protein kinase n=1 Tax=Streptomyces guryensis TaxID=2886947 RepID=A0A9Q3VIW6_9ACTN|nr:serine/threonine-protein kinase [Streptomyces guryensis]MCD9872344.1 protein kinase [Streptomyces guryensis]
MGRVWRAADEMLDRPVAVKEMRIDGLDAEDTRTRRERTLREARATARIDHPNVVRVYDVVDEGERLWIVMELVVGCSLERIMVEEGPLGPGETARIGLGLVAALRQVHARGVLHRDIKPGNVLVEGSGRRIVLTDFGIAAIQDAKALTMVGMLVGSPDYMAPERISGRPQGPPSDVWSLGATLCAALGGRSPFSRDTTLATLHAVLYEEPELPAAAGPLRGVLAALLEKEPSVRPSLPDLEEALRPVAFPAPTPTLPVRGGEGHGAEQEARGAGAEAAQPADEEEQPSESQEPPAAGPPEGAEPSPADAPAARAARDAETEPEPAGGSEELAGVDTSQQLAGVDASQQLAGVDASGSTEQAATIRRAPDDTPTPAHLDTRPVPTAPDPRRPAPAPVEDAVPQGQPDTHDFSRGRAPAPGTTHESSHNHTATPPAPSVPAQPPNASTEVPSELRSQARSETPSANSAPPAPQRSGVSLTRPHKATERPPAQRNGYAPAAVGIPSAQQAPVPNTQQAPDPGARQGPPRGLQQGPPPGLAEGPHPGPQRGLHPLRAPQSEVLPHRSRRPAVLVAAVGLLAVGAVVAVLLLTNPGSPGGEHAGSSTSPTTSATTPPGSPSPTVEGTSRPQSLPPGTRREAGGFAWAPPQGWRRDLKTGAEVHYTSPDGTQELVAKSSLARGDLMETWQRSEQDAHQGQGYRKIRLEKTTFRGNPAVVWEYTFTLKGTPWHARLLGFDKDGKSYQISTWYRPETEPQALTTYDEVKDSFTVL